jgi:hypothetical protein
MMPSLRPGHVHAALGAAPAHQRGGGSHRAHPTERGAALILSMWRVGLGLLDQDLVHGQAQGPQLGA